VSFDKKCKQAFKDADVYGRIILVLLVCLVLWGIAYLCNILIAPWLLRAYGLFIQISVSYMVACLLVSLVSPSTGSKMFRLFWHVLELLILDPLLSLVAGKSAKKK